MKKNKKQRRIMFLLILILSITVCFALLSTTLKINGTAAIKSNTWNIHWDDTSINVASGSVSASTPSVTTTTSTKDTVSFNIELELPGDFYEFEIDAINEGTIDGALSLLTTKIYDSNDQELTGENIPEYLLYSVKYSDGSTPGQGDILKAGNSKTYKIRVEFDSESSYQPSDDEEYTIKVTMPYEQHKPLPPNSFSTDSWETISNNTTSIKYHVGDTKEIIMDANNDGINETYHLRIVNKSTPDECSQDDFSETSCGFVVEFVDLLNITDSEDGKYNSTDTVSGGWKNSKIREYMNNNILNKLPGDLKDIIVSTKVISGGEKVDRVIDGHIVKVDNIYETQDKLYLYSPAELGIGICCDSAKDKTKILDFYDGKAASFRIKYSYELNTAKYWWLRSVYATTAYNRVYTISTTGVASELSPQAIYGIAPAFRIG